MKKKPQVGERIRSMRGTMSQAELADILGVKQATVSAWEVEENPPSAEACFKLATLATKPEDSLLFLEFAGLGRQAMLSVANKILEERSAPAKSGEVVRVSRFGETIEGREKPGPQVILPGELVPNRASTVYFVLDGKSASFMFAAGDIVVVDTSDAEVADLVLKPFFDKIVLMEFNADTLRKGMPYYHGPEGLFIGKLRLHRAPSGIGDSWETGLGPLDERFRVHQFTVGQWRYDYRYDSNPPRYRAQDPDRAEELAPEEIRLYQGCRVAGVVIAWLAKSTSCHA